MMEQYTVEQVADLVEESDIDAESDFEIESASEVEEDPDFPLPTNYSEDEDEQGSTLPVTTHTMHTCPLTSPPRSLRGKTMIKNIMPNINKT